MNTIHTRATNDALRQLLSKLPADARSADGILTRVGLAILGRIKRAFVTKARGGTDEAGDRWQPLSPKTVAYSRTRQRGKGGRTKAEKKRPNFPSQALNAKQQEQWWQVYRRALAWRKGDKAFAARIAWSVLKKLGAQTLLMKYGGRNVEILRDTGLLLNSLSPGSGTPEQVFKVGGGAVTVGTNRKGAAGHHNGIPGRLPQRRLWPSPGKWPKNWWDDLLATVREGILEMATQRIRGT